MTKFTLLSIFFSDFLFLSSYSNTCSNYFFHLWSIIDL